MEFSNTTTLIFKNIPKEVIDITNFLSELKIPAKEIKPFGRKRALITYELRKEAEQALNILNDLQFSTNTANISLFCKNKPNEIKKENIKTIVKKLHKGVQTTEGLTQEKSSTPQQISKYVQKLYATEEDLGFNQPPPPYLKYRYPPINKDILDNICISLLSNKRFYTQVLHLMNRMNLEPPFTERRYKFTTPGVPHQTGTQTEKIIIKDPDTLTENLHQELIDTEIESELESSDDEIKRTKPQTQLKRKLPPQTEQYKKKARQIFETTKKLSKESSIKSTKSNLSIKEIFETSDKSALVPQKIELQLKRVQKPAENKLSLKPELILPLDLKTQRLDFREIESLAIYKNYQKGETSNKLYIKNLHKDVTVEDLKLLYKRFIENNKNIKLDIKVMQHGRMKGQAFVTFLCDKVDILQPIVAQALANTNGFVIRDKPMVVCYGKQS